MPTLLTLQTAHRSDGQWVLSASGEIDLSNIDDFDEALSSATRSAEESGQRLVVDLSDLQYLDSAAINALFLRGEHIHIIAPQLLMSTLAMTGLTEVISVEAAPST